MSEGRNLIKKSHNQGTFDGYSVIGFQYGWDELHHAWHVTAWPNESGSPINDYWVESSEFREMSIHFAHPATGNNLIQTFGTAENVLPAEKTAILKAIAEWEVLEREKLLKDVG